MKKFKKNQESLGDQSADQMHNFFLSTHLFHKYIHWVMYLLFEYLHI
jgi:hypothetical protein